MSKHSCTDIEAITVSVLIMLLICPFMKKTISAIIVAPSSSEVRAVIRFWFVEGSSAAQVYQELCLVYEPIVVSIVVAVKFIEAEKVYQTSVHKSIVFVTKNDLLIDLQR